MYNIPKIKRNLSIQQIKDMLNNNKYPYVGAIIKSDYAIYPLIIIKGNESDFINFVEQNKLQVIDFTFGFDCGTIINEIFILNMTFYNDLLTINQLAEILFSLSEEELSMLNLISINPNKFIPKREANDNFDYQNISWTEQIINQVNNDRLKQLGYERKVN